MRPPLFSGAHAIGETKSMIDADAFRKTMRHIASGVFVTTTRLDGPKLAAQGTATMQHRHLGMSDGHWIAASAGS
jgi:hypothetical protein